MTVAGINGRPCSMTTSETRAGVLSVHGGCERCKEGGQQGRGEGRREGGEGNGAEQGRGAGQQKEAEGSRGAESGGEQQGVVPRLGMEVERLAPCVKVEGAKVNKCGLREAMKGRRVGGTTRQGGIKKEDRKKPDFRPRRDLCPRLAYEIRL